jgi:CRISPR-associated protein Csm4
MIVYLGNPALFNRELPRSDTLFGAICWAVRFIYGEALLRTWLERFDRGDPPFLVSSCFPYARSPQGLHHLFPIPQQPVTFQIADSLQDYQLLKKLKRITWVTQDVFNDMLRGLTLQQVCEDQLQGNKRRFRIHGSLLSGQDGWSGRVIEYDEVARNAINRLSGAVMQGCLFYSDVSQVATDGLYFLVRCDGDGKDETKAAIRGCIRYLAETGIGGDASIGRGHFRADFAELGMSGLFDEPDGERMVTLSLLHPSASDLAFLAAVKDRVYGRVERRKGFIESSYQITKRIWKPTLFMLGEGTTFPVDSSRGHRQLYGCVFRDRREAELPFVVRINGYGYTVRMNGSNGGGAL